MRAPSLPMAAGGGGGQGGSGGSVTVCVNGVCVEAQGGKGGGGGQGELPSLRPGMQVHKCTRACAPAP